MATVYERNFARLVKLLGQPSDLDFGRSYRLTAQGGPSAALGIRH